jgi:hypothetical protein
MKHAAITIDVDSIRHYRAIHGLEAQTDEEDPIYTIALPRFWALLDELQVPATFFLIGADAPAYASAFEPLLNSGSEVANHSFDHDYRLIQKTSVQIAEDLQKAHDALQVLNGGRPLRGFRAPGYNVSADLLKCVIDLDYSYDSSALPSPLYFGARWAVIQAYRGLGRESQSLAGAWAQFASPLAPYHLRPDAPFSPRTDGPLLELPIACQPFTRVPLIGTSLALLPNAIQTRFVQSALKRLSLFNFEMHGIDLLDASDHPTLKELSQYQSDLKIPARKKVDRHRRLFRELSSQAQICTLSQVAEEIG